MLVNRSFLRHHCSYKASSKKLSVFMILALVLSIFLQVLPVNATETVTEAEIKLENKTIQPGETVDIGVNVQGLGDSYLAGYIFTITYDESLIEVIDLKGTNAYPAPVKDPDGVFRIKTPGEFKAVSAKTTGANGDMKLFDITVKALNQVGLSAITLTVQEFAAATLLEIPVNKVSIGNVTIALAQPAAPSVSADDVNNVITGIDTTMEYKIDSGAYIGYTAVTIPDLSGTHTVLVRVAAAGSYPASEPTTLNFTTNPVIPAAPNVSADDVNNVITGIDTTMEYKIDSGAYIGYTAVTIPDLSGTLTVLVRVAAVGSNPASEPTTLNFTTNPVIPAAPNVSADDVNNVITGINATMEYKVDGGVYIGYTAATIPDLSGTHTVLVRVAAVGSNPASEPTTLNFTTNPVIPPAPNVSADDVNNVITGIDTTMEYKIDSGVYIAYVPANPPSLTGSHTVMVRVMGTTTMPAGLDAVLVYTDNQTMPTPTLVVKAGFVANESRVEVKLATLAPSNFSVSVLGTPLYYSFTREMFVGVVPSVDQNAMQNGLLVTEVSPTQIKYGDVNIDTNINVLDAIAVVRIATGRTVNPTIIAKMASDASGDGNVNVLDAIQIVRKATGRVQDLTIDTMK